MYEVWLSNARGERFAFLDQVLSLSCVRAANRIGVWSLTVPDVFPPFYWTADHVVEIQRNGRLEIAGLLRKIRYQGADDQAQVTLTGPDFLYVLDGRIVAYAAGESQSAKSDYADDLIKAVIRENLDSSASDSDRDLSSYNFSVQIDTSAGASVDRRFAWRNVLDTCRAFADESTQAGTRLYFDVVPYWVSETMYLQFRTYTGQRGQDRTYASNAPLIFGADYGNLKDPRLVYDYWDERNYVYAGGQGLGDQRLVEEQSDADRIAISPWNRRELFASVTNEQSASEIQSSAKAALDANKPRLRFSAELLSVPGAVYGEDWGYGDAVALTYRGKQFNGHIDTLRLTYRPGHEKITAKVEVLE